MKTLPVVLLLGGALPCAADYVVDVDLGVLPIGSSPLSGTTAATVIDPGPPEVIIGGNDNSVFVKNLDLNPEANWGNEIVYQFEVLQPSTISLASVSIDGDPDFFLLDGLQTSPDTEFQTGKIAADDGIGVAYLDDPPPQVEFLGAVVPGIYYLAVENFDGLDGAVSPGDSTFEISINIGNAASIDFPIDLGHIARAGSPFSLDTFGSEFDTELAVYTQGGLVLAENDNAGDGQQSEVVFPNGLSGGNYYAVIAGQDTTFGPNFSVSSGGEVGFWSFNFPLGPILGPDFESGVTDSTFPATETQFLFFSVNPAPPAPVDLGTIAEADEPFMIDTIGSSFDTQIGLYDREGFLLAFNDDIAFIEPGHPDNIFQSELVFDVGLPAGEYFLALAGYPNFFADGFFVAVDASSSDGGSFNVNHPLGVSTGTLPFSSQEWFTMTVASPATDAIEIVSLDFNPATNEFTVTWNTNLSGPFNIFAGTAGDLAALNPAPGNVLPNPAALGVTSPATFTVPAALQGEPQVFLQVTD